MATIEIPDDLYNELNEIGKKEKADIKGLVIVAINNYIFYQNAKKISLMPTEIRTGKTLIKKN